MRGVIDHDGQRVSALDRLYLADQIADPDRLGRPTTRSSRSSTAATPTGSWPHSRYVEIEGSGHWPMLDAPDRIVRELTDFMEETEPFEWSLETVRERLRAAPTPPPRRSPPPPTEEAAMTFSDLCSGRAAIRPRAAQRPAT